MDPKVLANTIEKVNLPDVNIAAEGEELTDAEQNKVSGGGGYGIDNDNDGA
jgi:hypothetical protein